MRKKESSNLVRAGKHAFDFYKRVGDGAGILLESFEGHPQELAIKRVQPEQMKFRENRMSISNYCLEQDLCGVYLVLPMRDYAGRRCLGEPMQRHDNAVC